MRSSGGGADRAHDVANAVHATITDDRTDNRINPTRNEYRRSAAAASLHRNGARIDDRLTLALHAL